MFKYEKIAWQESKYVCGIDEVGRGCLAGPILTAAVILPLNKKHKLLKDSKKLTEKEREIAYDWIVKNCYCSYSIFDHNLIDKINIYQATKLSMKKSLIQLFSNINFDIKEIKYVLIDAVPVILPEYYSHNNLEILNFNYGESISVSIAAASIFAKVTRDRLMENISQSFPKFNFCEHKGYGTSKHCETLLNNGPTIIHRKTFIKDILNGKNSDESKQRSLF